MFDTASWFRVFLVAILGVCGVLTRFSLNAWAGRTFGSELPIATFAANIVGSFAIGTVFVLADDLRLLNEEVRTALMVGFLGGFTTFSAFSLETFRLLERGRVATALSYFVASPILALAATFAGVWLTRLALGNATTT